ncbi:TolC family protein [Chitinophaga sp. Cy-1792]|uniref:TolC family protein n=1 Tax=Chitinophaga sp. Cy-1792 TaxID=2608339 RepID=UPI0014216B9B|nr:TolC family protein [Chitinophaga sp. Cy-1792]NIG56321.1 TolC family protein [Chitinophaga sp. Cy-1792]
MKKLLLLTLPLCFVLLSQAQQKDSLDLNTIQKNPGLEMKFRQVLIQLASKTPAQDLVDTKEKIGDYQVANARAQWLNHVAFFTNINENSFNRQTVYYNPNDPKANVNQNNYYPTYNVGLSFALGDFVTTPKMVKIARLQRKMLETERETDLRNSRAKVLTAYETFVANKKLFELELPLLEDALSTFQTLEKKFAAGETSLEDYNKAYKAYNAEQVQNVILTRSYNQSKIELESIINMPLEQAVQLVK